MPITIWDGTTQPRVDSTRGLRTTVVPRGAAFSASGMTGTVGAALAGGGAVFAMRLDPGAAVNAYIERVRLQWTTVVAFTTPVTAGRRLVLSRGSGAAAASGTAITAAPQKDTISAPSEFSAAQGGDIRIATTAALTVAGITFETEPLNTMPLVHVGAAGAFYEYLMEFHASENAPVVLQPGQVLAIRNGAAAMDAAGTWQLAVTVNWHEAAAYGA